MPKLSCLLLAAMIGLISAAKSRADEAATRPSGTCIVVMPFEAVGEPGHEWVGRAMQEGLANGITRQHDLQAVIVPAVGTIDTQSAMNAGRIANADYVILGSVQFNEDQMRVGGQVISIHTGRSVGTLSSDGGLHDLFSMEDALSDRTVRLVA